MRRREFIALVGGAMALAPLAARAQLSEQSRRVGVLLPGAETDPYYSPRTTAFRDGLRELGWLEGRNILFEYRWTRADPERNRAYAGELVVLAPEVILVTSTPLVRALRQSTSTIPIVFMGISDPVGDGFVASLARPGGNATGFSNYDPSMIGKWLQLLKEIAPHTKRLAVIFNPDTAPHSVFLPSIMAAAPSLGIDAIPAQVRSKPEIEKTIATLGSGQAAALLVMPDSFTVYHRDLVATLAARYRLPAIYPFTFFAASGGLICYGVDTLDQYRRAPAYVDRILRGAKPGDLPVQQPTKFELVINLKAAKALGLEIQPSLLARADEVIE